MSSLADRLAEASHDRVAPAGPAEQRAGGASGSSTPADLRDVSARVREGVLARLGARLADPALTGSDEAEELVRSAVQESLQSEDLLLTSSERHRVLRECCDDLLGHGPIEPYLRDPDLTQVLVNGCDQVYVERGGRLVEVEGRFTDEAQLRRVIDRLVARGGRRVDESTPMVEARLPDGSRVTAVLPPLAVDGPLLAIRKAAPAPYTPADLVAVGTCSQQAADVLAACVRGRLGIVVSGGPGSGRTTTLSVLASFIPADERIVTVEDAAELQLRQDHVLRLETRPPDARGGGEVRLRDLLTHALRLRPDRIVVGDVRDDAALVLLQAMSTGHAGSLCAVHSTGPSDTLARLETMALLGGADPSGRAVREQVAAAVDVVVHQSRLLDGSRRITHVTEVRREAGGRIGLHDLFVLDSSTRDGSGRVRGRLRATGARPAFHERLAAAEHRLDPALFAADGP